MNSVKAPLVHPRPPAFGSTSFFGVGQGELLRNFVTCAKTHTGMTNLVYVPPSQAPVRKPSALRGKGVPQVIAAEELGFERVPISLRSVGRALASRLGDTPAGTVLAVDMGWGLQTASATANFEGWTGVADDLAAQTGRTVVSLYNRSLLIDEHLLTALRGHALERVAFNRFCILPP
jgi:hypothetical protein